MSLPVFVVLAILGAAIFTLICMSLQCLIMGVPIHDVWTWSPERYTRRRGKIYAYFKNRSLKKSTSV